MMGVQVEFNPDLALRAFGTKGRGSDECLPEKLEVGKQYPFLKIGQRNYWLEGEIPLLETKGNQNLSRPLASIVIQKATHLRDSGELWTVGTYSVMEVFHPADETVHFEGYSRRRV